MAQKTKNVSIKTSKQGNEDSRKKEVLRIDDQKRKKENFRITKFNSEKVKKFLDFQNYWLKKEQKKGF